MIMIDGYVIRKKILDGLLEKEGFVYFTGWDHSMKPTWSMLHLDRITNMVMYSTLEQVSGVYAKLRKQHPHFLGNAKIFRVSITEAK